MSDLPLVSDYKSVPGAGAKGINMDSSARSGWTHHKPPESSREKKIPSCTPNRKRILFIT